MPGGEPRTGGTGREELSASDPHPEAGSGEESSIGQAGDATPSPAPTGLRFQRALCAENQEQGHSAHPPPGPGRSSTSVLVPELT